MLLKVLCDESCVTTTVRTSIERRRKKCAEVILTAESKCRRACTEAKASSRNGLLSSSLIQSLNRLCDRHQRSIDDPNTSIRIDCLGEDGDGNRYFWHGPSGAKITMSGDASTLSVDVPGCVFVQCAPNDSDTRQWFRLFDHPTGPLSRLVRSLDSKGGRSVAVRRALAKILACSQSAHSSN